MTDEQREELVPQSSEPPNPLDFPIKDHQAVQGNMDTKLTIVVLRIGETMEHGRTQELNANRHLTLVGHSRMPANNRDAIEGSINRLHAQAQYRVGMRYNQALALGR
jgi:hypothetical protein